MLMLLLIHLHFCVQTDRSESVVDGVFILSCILGLIDIGYIVLDTVCMDSATLFMPRRQLTLLTALPPSYHCILIVIYADVIDTLIPLEGFPSYYTLVIGRRDHTFILQIFPSFRLLSSGLETLPLSASKAGLDEPFLI